MKETIHFYFVYFKAGDIVSFVPCKQETLGSKHIEAVTCDKCTKWIEKHLRGMEEEVKA